jgi:putative spermidine/putrescine transport system ATP-binding protein
MKDRPEFVSLKNLVKRFGTVTAVDNVSLSIDRGEFVTLLGPSGSGKTTTLMMVAGFESPNAGEIFIAGESMTSKPPHRRDIGMVFQSYALFPHMTVFENIAFPLRNRKTGREKIQERVKTTLALVKLPGLEGRYPKQLSGGQQQRVALARALVFNPSVLLMDEPLGALDKKLREHMQLEIKRIQEALKITVLYVTHDQSEALTMSDRIVVMNEGRIVQIGSPSELYEEPADAFVADFIGESNFIEGLWMASGEERIRVDGERATYLSIRSPRVLHPGERVKIALRPEKLFFLDGGASADNAVEGVVESIVYLGDVTKYEIRLKGTAQVLVLKQQNRLGMAAFDRGSRVRIGWRAEDGKLV